MKDMHAKQKDHLWVLAVIAACCLIKVWPSWVGIGAEAGFPKIVKMPTDWTLAVVVEAYWAYAVYAWLAASPGNRSRRFAMWSAAGVFVLSLTAQSTEGLMNAKAADAFANAMPVTILALIAVLVHLRHTDRDAAAKAERAQREAAREAQQAAAAADERTALRAELAAIRAEVIPLREALAAAESDRDTANAKAESAAVKLAAQKANGRRTKPANGAGRKANAPAKRTANDTTGSPANEAANGTPETTVPDDLDARAQALEMYLSNPKISGKDLGEAVGLTPRWGQLRRAEFAASAPTGQDPQE